MHWGQDPVLEKHYVPRRSQRTRSVLTFFAEDAATHTLLYANADLSKASQNREVIAFAGHWKAVTGSDPALLIFDSKLTTQAVLAELDNRGIGFITLRPRHPGVTRTLAALPASAWTPMTLGRAGNTTRRVKVHDDAAALLSAYPRADPPARRHRAGPRPAHPADHQPARPARPAGHPVLCPADEHRAAPRRSYPVPRPRRPRRGGPAQRRPRVVLSVLAHTVCAALRRRLPGYAKAIPDTLQRRFLNTGAIILNHRSETVIRLNRRTYSPVLRQASLPETITVPWWEGRALRYEYA
jgi:hypothetical protein